MASLRQRITVSTAKAGTGLNSPICISSSSQESSGTDSTTPSSHLQDSQDPDEDYEPALGTQTIGSEGAAIQEELEDILNAPGAVDTDMLQHEHDKTTPPTSATAGSNTATYTIILRNFNPEDPTHQCRLVADTEKHGLKKGFKGDFDIKIHPLAGRNKIVEIVWEDIEDFRLAKRINFKIYWKSIPITTSNWGPALDCRARAIKVHLPPGQKPEDYLNAFVQSCQDNITITHAWVVGTGPKDASKATKYGGILVAVVRLAGTGHLTLEELHSSLPAWTLFAGRSYENHFAGAIQRCRHCRHKSLTIHSSEECPVQYCTACRKRHLPDECDKWGYRGTAPQGKTSSTSSDDQPRAQPKAYPTIHNRESHKDDRTQAPPAPPSAHDQAGPSRLREDTTVATLPKTPPRGSYGAIIANLNAKAMDPPKTSGKGKGKATQSSASVTQPSIVAFFSPKRKPVVDPSGSPPPRKMARQDPE
ncbi:hypothetical protein CF336_g8593 [Tilletia laevis]|uniref:Uncharacterized protein n=1 Tax=Tilletia caries TaxID=13290 RepID=A0ABN7IJZ7_9BASI|nr:hypothetical protein CF336_g8593 [Tilletia laevis]CAD6896950.1 unnamed protein product [Tilletia caries]CAD7061904.1 unnamed protein product [Tilletia caries]